MKLFSKSVENNTIFLGNDMPAADQSVYRHSVNYMDIERDSDLIEEMSNAVMEGLTYAAILTSINYSITKEVVGSPSYKSVCLLGRSVMDALPKRLNLSPAMYVPSLEGMVDYVKHKHVATEGLFSAIGNVFKAIWEFIKKIARAIGKFFSDLFKDDEKVDKELEKKNKEIGELKGEIRSGDKVYYNPSSELIESVKLSDAFNKLGLGSHISKDVNDIKALSNLLLVKINDSKVITLLKYMDELIDVEYNYAVKYIRATFKIIDSPLDAEYINDVDRIDDQYSALYTAAGFDSAREREVLDAKRTESVTFNNIQNSVGDSVNIAVNNHDTSPNELLTLIANSSDVMIPNSFTPIQYVSDYDIIKSAIPAIVKKQNEYSMAYTKSNKITSDVIDKLSAEFTRLMTKIASSKDGTVDGKNVMLNVLSDNITTLNARVSGLLRNYLTVSNTFLTNDLNLHRDFKIGLIEYIDKCNKFFVLDK